MSTSFDRCYEYTAAAAAAAGVAGIVQPTCADTDVSTASAEAWPCPAGEVHIAENKLWSPPSDSACCTVRF
jgi:hypothetical protein